MSCTLCKSNPAIQFSKLCSSCIDIQETKRENYKNAMSDWAPGEKQTGEKLCCDCKDSVSEDDGEELTAGFTCHDCINRQEGATYDDAEEDDKEWRREIAREEGMLGGCEAYNDYMGY